MAFLHLFFVYIVTFTSTISVQISVLGCLVSSRTGVPTSKQPLYIQAGQLTYPTEVQGASYLSVATSNSLTLGCPGAGNTVVGGSQIEPATCVANTTFTVNTLPTILLNVNCTTTPKSGILETSTNCGPVGSKIIEVGFQLDKWYKLFETCHNTNATLTAFATHKLSYLTEIGSQQFSERPAFKKGSAAIYKNLDPENLYKKTTQEAMFQSYLGSTQYYDSSRFYFSKGHLAPDADFIFVNWQWATYFYVDTAPQWFSLNSGNWLAVERAVRDFANASKYDLEVGTGTYDILRMADNNGVQKPMYLDPNNNGIPVPRVFWKSVYHPQTDAGVVFLMENNPWSPGPPLCQDICSQAGWTFSNSLDRGTVYCCRQSTLLPTIPYMTNGQAANLLVRTV